MCGKEIKDMNLHTPEPTMPFNSFVSIKHHDKVILELDTTKLLRSVGADCEYRIKNPQSANITQRRPYDWTFQPTLLSELGSEPGQELDEACLKDTSTPILYFATCDFYEDELADNGRSIASFKIRVMQWGFVCLLSHHLHIDHDVADRCEEVRLLHKFSKNDGVQVEWSLREGKDGSKLKVNKNLFV